jgi:hypothetical protein
MASFIYNLRDIWATSDHVRENRARGSTLQFDCLTNLVNWVKIGDFVTVDLVVDRDVRQYRVPTIRLLTWQAISFHKRRCDEGRSRLADQVLIGELENVNMDNQSAKNG